ncbi:hypothetical protein HNY73_010626 [Argiope bruennichi]|uniref:Uncharacterized protein n=1 Tax=Argiope bruennichi TaxID=94029 RepID=A0A8T0F6I8_ARGBR|nr:hypothetical protein HNY73_010626 [Argiope bruennichi]
MAFINEYSVFIIRQEAYFSHEVRYCFTVNNFPAIDTLEFSKSFDTECTQNPTIWDVSVKLFKQSNPSQTVACIFTLKRSDTRPASVRLSCTVDFLTNSNQPLCPSKGFPPREIQNGFEMKEIYDPVIPNNDMTLLPGQMLTVTVRLSVMSCHRPRRRVSRTVGFTFDDIEMLTSKL